AANNPNVVRYLSHRMPHPYTVEHAKWWVATGHKELGENYLIEFEDKFAGVIGVIAGQHEHQKSAEIGYWLAESMWGRGIATMAITQLCDEVFSRGQIIRISAPVYAPNKASMRALEKSGFHLESIQKNTIFKHGQMMDQHLFVRLYT
ncbi:MAG: GNAT family N-acetyltransferase, partial [Pseudomonadota bacterium]